jgi:hypothetical protein
VKTLFYGPKPDARDSITVGDGRVQKGDDDKNK